LKAAVRGLAAGEKDYEQYKKIFQTKFVFLNEYTTSVKAEEDPRGPEGPYRFQDRSVPVVVLKRWDGETLVQQLGFQPDPEQAKRALAQIVDKALKDHGPVVPPKALRPLLKSFEAGKAHLEKRRVAAAIREFQKVEKLASDPKKFPETPDVAKSAADELAKLAEEGLKLVEDAKAAPDPAKAIREVQREYGALPAVAEKAKEALAALPE
jgi:hypothetical protein